MTTGRWAVPALLALGALVAAPSYGADVRPALKVSAEFGGDKLVSVGTTGSSSSDSLYAGQGLALGGGVSILNDAKDIETEVTLSYKFFNIHASNGDIDFSVIPLDALVFYRIPHWRFGGGLTYHMNPKLKGSGDASGLEAEYKNALGIVLQADYMFGQSQKMKLGLRYTNVKYKASKIQDTSIIQVNSEPPASANTNALGLVFTVAF